MKKVMLICFVVMAMGCKSLAYQESSIKIGMLESEFKQENRRAELMLGDDNGVTIYRIITNSWIPKLEPYSFFYFNEGKLTRYIKSYRMDDYKFIH